MSKTALITGISGQDGAYLAKLLLEKGYTVYGAIRRTASLSSWRLKELGVYDQIKLVPFELSEYMSVVRALEQSKPDEIYNLAAQSFVGLSFEQPLYTSDIDAIGVTRVLEAIRAIGSGIKFYQASTSEMFGKVREPLQSETTPFYPRSPYGVAKLYAHWMTVNYREAYDLYACSGILFNHESPLRGAEFVTRKITIGLAKIKLGLESHLELGNLEAQRDWGYAADYVEGMHLMLQQAEAEDYVLATGETHSVRQFIVAAAECLGIKLEWQGEGPDTQGIDADTGNALIKINPVFYRPTEVDVLVGDSAKAKQKLGWQPKTSFEQLVELMVDAEMRRLTSDQLVLDKSILT